MSRFVRVFLNNPPIAVALALGLILAGIWVAPFEGLRFGLEGDPVPVDALPDLGENQQIVYTEWPGRSPQDVEDQITYPLTAEFLGLSSVRTIRTSSHFGFSSIYILFEDDAPFYWTRSRILEKLNSLPANLLPPDATPSLGPDATAVGQVYWYTLEGEGFDPHELRSIQDFQVRFALQAVPGVAEVASVGGFVREYQVDVDPDAMRSFGVSLKQVVQAVKNSNVDVGARTLEINRAEYIVRGVGNLKGIEDLENTVVAAEGNTPITLRQVARVVLGPAERRGALDDAGVEAVGGVVVTRFGENARAVLQKLRATVDAIQDSLPTRTLADGSVSQVRIVPFYDRGELIEDTIDTLEHALGLELLITMLVLIFLIAHLRGALIVAGALPLTVLAAFFAMKIFGVDSHLMSLSGIAIAIGTMVDMGIVVVENIIKRLKDADTSASTRETIFQAVSEVASAVTTSAATTVVSFLPVLTLTAAEGKLFKPLALTKTFALVGAWFVAMAIIPPVAAWLLPKHRSLLVRRVLGFLALVGAGFSIANQMYLAAIVLVIAALVAWFETMLPLKNRAWSPRLFHWSIGLAAVLVLAKIWSPLGPTRTISNFLWVLFVVAFVLLLFYAFSKGYERLLRSFLVHKLWFFCIPLVFVVLGFCIWLGVPRTFGFIPSLLANMGIEKQMITDSAPWRWAADRFPGLGREFMPPLDEGSFLYMPTTMPHASIGEALAQLSEIDAAIATIPEVDRVVGKLGRVESALDPAPISMFETLITVHPEYRKREDGSLERVWRDEIQSVRDIWDQIVRVAQVPGVTSAPYLQPIAARTVMLQSGMRAPMGIKITGPDLESLERAALQVEAAVKEVPGIRPDTVLADRIVGKPYLEIHIDRLAIARWGISVREIQDVIEVAIGGKAVTTTIEGRERYAVRVRYPRERRGSLESIGNILVASSSGSQVPLKQLAEVRYTRGPQVIKGENAFSVAYVTFDRDPVLAEANAVERVSEYLVEKRLEGSLVLPAGVAYTFDGTYINQLRSEQTLKIMIPIVLLTILFILYMQFRSLSSALFIFVGVLTAWSGGFFALWLFGQPELFTWFGIHELFQMQPMALSVAVWVGFIALFGIATDDGVLMSTYIRDSLAQQLVYNTPELHDLIVEGAQRRVKACLATSATTLLALLPILTTQGRGSEVMVPMALPLFGGMVFAMLTLFMVPVLTAWREERRLRRAQHGTA